MLLIFKSIYVAKEFSQMHKERAETEGEGRLESNKNWSGAVERREKNKLKIET